MLFDFLGIILLFKFGASISLRQIPRSLNWGWSNQSSNASWCDSLQKWKIKNDKAKNSKNSWKSRRLDQGLRNNWNSLRLRSSSLIWIMYHRVGRNSHEYLKLRYLSGCQNTTWKVWMNFLVINAAVCIFWVFFFASTR